MHQNPPSPATPGGASRVGLPGLSRGRVLALLVSSSPSIAVEQLGRCLDDGPPWQASEPDARERVRHAFEHRVGRIVRLDALGKADVEPVRLAVLA